MAVKILPLHRPVSLRTRIALAIMVPILMTLTLLSLSHYWREQQLLEGQIRLTTLQLGEAVMGSLRHAMQLNDSQMLAEILADIGSMENIHEVQIIDLRGQVGVDSSPEEVGNTRQLEDLGCRECHELPPESRPQTLKLSAPSGVLRVASPITNDTECQVCHPNDNPHLGMLLVDVSLVDIEQHRFNDLRSDLVVSGLVTVLVALAMYWLIHRLVVRRVEAFRLPLARFGAGDFSSRIAVASTSADELDELAVTFNQMADELQHHAREQEERQALRQRAIAEERERIARELHDGLAQLLGYVNTKAMAVRMMLHHGEIDAADQYLLQLEEAARSMFIDVREAILNLRVAGRCCTDFFVELEEFRTQFSRLSGLAVALSFEPGVEGVSVTGEAHLQLLRIVQEALANVRKHASASGAQVTLRLDGNILELSISDDGVGFAPEGPETDDRLHFGLSTMRERAEAIGATLVVDSLSGAGTRVVVRYPLQEPSDYREKEP